MTSGLPVVVGAHSYHLYFSDGTCPQKGGFSVGLWIMLTESSFPGLPSSLLKRATDAHDVWTEAMAVLSQKLSAQNFDLWFRPIHCEKTEGHCLHLVAPNFFIKEWFETHYLRVVLDTIEQLSDRNYTVTWRLDDEVMVDAGDDDHAWLRPSTFAKPPVKKEAQPRPAVCGNSTATKNDAGGHDKKERSGTEPETEHPNRCTFESFVVGPSSQLVSAACLAVAGCPGGKYNPLFIFGGAGLGKTHLLHALRHRLATSHPGWRVAYLKAETFMNEYISAVRTGKIEDFRGKYRYSTDVLLVDDIQYLGGKERTQDEFFHTFNSLFEAHKQIVVTADKYPHEIANLDDRIRSRFQWGLIVDIDPPGVETRVAILHKKAELEKITLPDDVALFLASHVRSNVRELEGLLIRVVACASLEQRPITVPFVQETLCDFLGQTSVGLTVEAVQRGVANYFGVRTLDLSSGSRSAAITRPRQIAMYLARELCKCSFPEIGTRFGGKDHTTVMAACRKVRGLLTTDPHLPGVLREIERQLVS